MEKQPQGDSPWSQRQGRQRESKGVRERRDTGSDREPQGEIVREAGREGDGDQRERDRDMYRDKERRNRREMQPQETPSGYDLRQSRGETEIGTLNDSATARRSEAGRARRSEAGAAVGLGAGRCGLRDPRPPTLVMPFPMIPGAGVLVQPQLAAGKTPGSQLP